TISIRWFFGGYLAKTIQEGTVIAVSGKVCRYRGALQFINPGHQVIYDPHGTSLDRDELMPVYPASGKLSSNIIAGIIKIVLPEVPRLIRPWFDKAFLAKRSLMDRPTAITAMHNPDDREHWLQARRRLAYDECMLMQLGIALMRTREVSRPAHSLKWTPAIDSHIRARFPFELTAAQNGAIKEIVSDLAKNHPMNRLVQGDVGSGKTVVAVYAALTAVANKKQVAIMAPTEILARQHYEKITRYLDGSQVRTALLVGAMPGNAADRIRAELANGDVHIVVGTHALLGETVKFRELALVIVDEQHKFGVEQRTGLRGKGFAPHYLVMTATPIPRTLAMTVFGDLDVSTIDSLPPGRGVTHTSCVTPSKFDEVIDFTANKIRQGQQAYFIYPLVTPSPTLELQAAEQALKKLSAGPLGEFGVGMIHGQMKAEQKNDIMRAFAAGRIKILVASVVVEVGVDVSQANVIVINHAERFGLAQLHQLRGRVGRSADDANCILVASPNNPIAKRRMEILCETSDGFKISEEDLRLRGPGEIFGTRQHGMPELKVADLVEDFDLLRLARRDAFKIIEEDPDLAAPHNQQLRRMMLRMYAGKLTFITGA
ncbi:MAG TPA: ATP-dependent DNA helicase RecG, partial [Phycisphaerae bacterium]|nr:ATP-dependent DNA helicase RecG [Phycisphaerae bacterium]